MKKNLDNINRKDCSPEETINKVKAILGELNISIYENSWESFDDLWHSVRLEIDGLPNIGVNGKGISREYALASAYGELMERLQSRMLIKPRFGNRNDLEYIFHDEVELSLQEILSNCGHLLDNFVTKDKIDVLKFILDENSEFKRCIPFFSMSENRIRYLPYKLIDMCCGSNGLCAGNTKEEAIIQGISEILERHAHRMIFEQSNKLSEIPLEHLKHLHTYSLLQEIIKAGFTIIIKDCSVFSVLPVFGLLILNKNRDRYKFVLGCDPDINIALQRCVTELFQGVKFDLSFEKRMKKIDWNIFNKFNSVKNQEWLMTLISNSGHHPLSVFSKESKLSKTDKYFMQNKKNNKEVLDIIIYELKKLGFEIYIRNYSYLGFPCYRVFIPSLSECAKLSDEEMFFLQNEKLIRNAYCNMKSCNKNEFIVLQKALTGLKNIPKYCYYNFSNILNMIINRKEMLEKLDYNLVMFLINMQIKNPKGALDNLNNFINGNEQQFYNEKYIRAIRYFLMIKPEHLGSGDENYLVDQATLQKIQRDYWDEKTIERYALPSCPDCENCNIESCYYEKWRQIDLQLKEKEKSANLLQN